ncbi:MAG: 7-cyano-7-deazaguanine synthase QueC [Armatimonadetes bacterium]|jgi:7-cyano-7-deazaguanine synthase|nr:7-cyano-7-deazaguanine synthase QueC [Armatimonadota bacterium]
MSRAVVLLSGGLDSATTAAVARSEGFELYAISFDYGQRHTRELESAKLVATSIGVKDHLIISFDLRAMGGSALTDDINVPLDRKTENMAETIPITYVPARNTIFLSFALGYAETLKAYDIFIGVSEVDYSGYPDCRIEYIEAFERMANLATKAGIEGTGRFRIRTPLIDLSKADAIRRGLKLGLDYSLTWSCYMGDKKPCGRCDSCKLRLAAFAEVGIDDPLEYM